MRHTVVRGREDGLKATVTLDPVDGTTAVAGLDCGVAMLDGVLNKLVVATLKVEEVHPLRAQRVTPVAAADPAALHEAEGSAHQHATGPLVVRRVAALHGRSVTSQDQQDAVWEALGQEPEESGAQVEADLLRAHRLCVAVADLRRSVAAPEDLGHELDCHSTGVEGTVHDFDLQALLGCELLPLPLDGTRLLGFQGSKEVLEVLVRLRPAVRPPRLPSWPSDEARGAEELAFLGRAEGHVHAQLRPLGEQDERAEECLLHGRPLGRPEPVSCDEAATPVWGEWDAYEEFGVVGHTEVVGCRDPIHLLAEFPVAVQLQVEGHGAHDPPAASRKQKAGLPAP
mmetsp:Transcript_80115/g.238583  ORF Transcript_80115/g.238583 Transcript_80115/m.238583 type:complete len:341 (-) Transcript_80115:564-1586(-)